MYIKYRALFNRGSIDGVGHVAPKLAVAVGSSLGRGKAGSLAAGRVASSSRTGG